MHYVILNKDGVGYFFYSRLIYKDLLSVIHAIKAVFTTNDLETELQNGIFNPNMVAAQFSFSKED